MCRTEKVNLLSFYLPGMPEVVFFLVFFSFSLLLCLEPHGAGRTLKLTGYSFVPNEHVMD